MAQTSRLGTVATTVHVDKQGYTNVTYQSTVVVRFNEREIVLRNGGWYTATTKCRINQAANQFKLNLRVSQVKGKWYVDRFIDGWQTLPFVDGMAIPRY